MALILVVVIAALLVAVALPFAFSMGQQEKGARGVSDRAHARYAAAAARNRAVAAAVPGCEMMEERKTSPVPFNTPFSDTPAEFSAGRAGKPMAPGLDTGALVADEQGKINVRTAPQMCVENLMKRIDPRVDDVRDYLTESSGRPAAWIAPQTIRFANPWVKNPKIMIFAVDNMTHLSVGTRIRVSGHKVVQVGEVVDVDPKMTWLGLKDVCESAETDALLEIEQRHPLNINTASREALAACFEGLALRNHIADDKVTRGEATRLAEAMVSKTFESWEEFYRFLAEQLTLRVISGYDYTAIVLNSKWPTDYELACTGTVPLTLQSWNLVTVAARGVVERPNRAVGGECDVREIVEVAPPGTLKWRCVSQEDFRNVLDREMSRGMFTGPAFSHEWPIRERSRGAWLTGLTGIDKRGAFATSMHFGPSNEGKAVDEGMAFAGLPPFQKGQVVTWPSGATEFWFLAPANDATIFESGDEEWSNRILLTYEGTGGAMGGPYLRLLVKDATLEKGFSQVVHRVQLTAKRWYHVGAFWKSTRNGGMMMTLDGLPVGDWRAVGEGPAQQKGKELGVAVHLASDVGKTDSTIDSDFDVSDFPSPGAIAIGQEVIEYQNASGTSFKGCTRAARGSLPWNHQTGETIAPWGYTDFVVDTKLDYTSAGFDVPVLKWDRILTCAGELKYALGTRAQTTTAVVSLNPAVPPKIGLKTGETVLDVPVGSTAGFPDEGWLLIGNAQQEIVHYSGKSNTQFTGLDRGQFGTPNGDYWIGEPVVLNGFHVTTNSGFPDPAIICIGNEFFGPLQKVNSDGWVALVGKAGNKPAPWPLFRGAEWGVYSSDTAHPAAAPVLPTFALEDAKAGRGDRVTLLQKDYDIREEARIACAAWLEPWKAPLKPPALRSPATTAEWPFLLAAFDRRVQDEVVADRPFNTRHPNSWGRFNIRRHSRVIQFPSGELPYCDPAPLRIGVSVQGNAPGELGGWIDELRCSTAEYEHWCLARALDASETELIFGIRLVDDCCGIPPPPVIIPWTPPTDPGVPAPKPVEPPEPTESPVSYTPLDMNGGAILVDDEVIGYVSYEPGSRTLKGLKRGYLGTTARPHSKCSIAFPLTYLAIAALKKGVDARDDAFATADSNGFPQEGYFLVDRELVGWTKRGPTYLSSPLGCDFRGAFGTKPEGHLEDSLLYAMPWRFFDRYTIAADDTDLHWFEATTRATGAHWKSIKWEEMFSGASVDIRVFVRFDRSGRWIHLPLDAKKAKKEAIPRFYGFDDDKGGKLGDTVGDQLDVRVMFEYLDGAYAKDQWKECPQFRGFEVEYEQENVVHRHEEK
ncbi:MAG: hypothetical protein FD180_4097 [Planctomycetota bacterium]|nr:MAG: hypothetical protein FD180_4097 [Planctomycetota bacterium]